MSDFLGTLCEMGSWSQGDHPYNLDPRLLNPEKGPRWYFDNMVEPLVARGVNHIVFHRPFGEPIYGDGAIDYDTWHYLTQDNNDPAMRDYCMLFLRELLRLAQRHPSLTFTVYQGGIWGSRMKALRDLSIRDWADRVWSQITAFDQLGLGDRIRYAFDASSVWTDERGNPRMEQAEWIALSMIRAVLGADRVLLEATPRDDQPDQWWLPSIAWEPVYQYQASRRSHIGKVVRILGNTPHDGVWSDRAMITHNRFSPLALFLFECENLGHEPVIKPEVYARYSDLPSVRAQVSDLMHIAADRVQPQSDPGHKSTP